MSGQRLAIAAVSAFLVGIIVCVSYMVTSGMYNPLHNLVAMSESWAIEGTDASSWRVSPDTVVKKQSIYLCGDTESEEELEPKALMGLSQDELMKMFDTKDGWQVQFLSPQELVLARRVNELCPEHKDYQHLGIYQDKVAIFEGPLGADTQLVRVVQDKGIQDLPTSLQQKLQQASEFYKLDSETQAQLQAELEFKSEVELNAMLENIDELD